MNAHKRYLIEESNRQRKQEELKKSFIFERASSNPSFKNSILFEDFVKPEKSSHGELSASEKMRILREGLKNV